LLVMRWDMQVWPAVVAFVNGERNEKSDHISKEEFEKYDIGILQAAARSQLTEANESNQVQGEVIEIE